MDGKFLGKIKSVWFGLGGYQDVQLGYSFDLEFDGSGVGDFWGFWADKPEYAAWTEEDQIKRFGESNKRVRQLMKDAKVQRLDQLNGIPIEVTIEGNCLRSWRILTEVI